MSQIERQILITVQKIYNWGSHHHQGLFQFSFYSVANNALLLSQQVPIHIINNQFIINSSLKITYTQQESQILLLMQKIEEQDKLQGSSGQEIYNQFIINLEHLNENKVQYLPFKKNQKVLKIIEGSPLKESSSLNYNIKNHTKVIKNHDIFIRQKQQFLRGIKNNSNLTNTHRKSQKKLKLVQNLYNLLQEVRNIRSQNHLSKSVVIQQSTNYQNDHLDYIKQSQIRTFSNNNKRLRHESRSEGNLHLLTSNEQQQPIKRYHIYDKYKLNVKQLKVYPYNIQQLTNKQEQEQNQRQRQRQRTSNQDEEQVYNYLSKDYDYVIDPYSY